MASVQLSTGTSSIFFATMLIISSSNTALHGMEKSRLRKAQFIFKRVFFSRNGINFVSSILNMDLAYFMPLNISSAFLIPSFTVRFFYRETSGCCPESEHSLGGIRWRKHLCWPWPLLCPNHNRWLSTQAALRSVPRHGQARWPADIYPHSKKQSLA